MRFRRLHPSERALHKYGQLSPELRELIARVVRSVAKDAVQEVMEQNELPFITPSSITPLPPWMNDTPPAVIPPGRDWHDSTFQCETPFSGIPHLHARCNGAGCSRSAGHRGACGP